MIHRQVTCERCGALSDYRDSLVRAISPNGAARVYHQCRACGENTFKPARWLSHNRVRWALVTGNVDELPIVEDQRGGMRCEVCDVAEGEWHHWAPQAMFPDADKWPMSYLCRPCHKRWHQTVTPGLVKAWA